MTGKIRPPHQFEIGDRVKLNEAGKESGVMGRMKLNPNDLGPVVGFRYGCVTVVVRTRSHGKTKPRLIKLDFRPEHLELVKRSGA